MKRFLLILCILSFPIFCFGQVGWVDTGGSTWAATSAGVAQEIKDIQNDVHDRGVNSWRVTISTGLEFLFVLVSTNTDFIGAKLEKIYIRDSSGTAKIVSDLEKAYVLGSTNTATIMAEMLKHYVLISTGGDTTVIRLDTINTELIKHYVLSSTNTAEILVELIKYYVLSSTNTAELISELSIIQGSLSSIDTNLEHCDTHDVAITSGTIKEFQVSNATGTVLIVGTGASSSYTLQAGVVEIIMEADKTNTDITRWRYWNDNVKTAGNKLHPGDVWILDKWTGTAIYFQTEAGNQNIIIQEIYE